MSHVTFAEGPTAHPAAHWVLLATLFLHSIAQVAHADGMNVECVAENKTALVLLTHPVYFWSLMATHAMEKAQWARERSEERQDGDPFLLPQGGQEGL